MSKNRKAFSLIELLLTIAVISVLVSLGVTSFQGFQGGRKLSTAGSRVMGLFESARENAILKGQPTAIVMLLKDESARRAFAALEREPTGTWKQVSKWEVLPEGVLVDSSSGQSSLPLALSQGSSPQVTPALSSVSFRGKSYTPQNGYAYLIFMPDGSLYQSGNGSLTLVEGELSNDTVRRKGNGLNSFEILINDATGRVRAARL